LLFFRPAAFLRLQDPTDKTRRTFHKRLVPQRSARATMRTQLLQQLVGWGAIEQAVV
jgi:hypothetical protein